MCMTVPYSVSGIKHSHYKRALQSSGGTLSELEIPK